MEEPKSKKVSLEGEVWRDVVGYEGLYEVSNTGRVYSHKTNKTLKIQIDRNGYGRVNLWGNNLDRKGMMVHRIVALAFIPNPDNKPVIDHINTNPSDNTVDNLRWCTQRENLNNAKSRINMSKGQTEESRIKRNNTRLKLNCKFAPKPVYRFDSKGNLITAYHSTRDAAEELGINVNSISTACIKKNACHGFLWSRNKEYGKLKTRHRNNVKILQLTKSGDFIREWNSIADAGRFFNVNYVTILNALDKENRTSCGYKWKRA